jgi:hypothetical protein
MVPLSGKDKGLPGYGLQCQGAANVSHGRTEPALNAISPGIIPENESQRMAAVRRYDILDTPPDGAFDRITAIAARRFDVPISIS